jgi:hypothetical protein
MLRASDAYFDEDREKQTKRFPAKWMDASRFEVGAKIEFLESLRVATKLDAHGHVLEWSDLKGQIGIVQKLNNGYGDFPPRFFDPSGGDDPMWIGQHCGWLTVKFPFDIYRDSKGNFQARACSLEDEGTRWRLLTAEVAS